VPAGSVGRPAGLVFGRSVDNSRKLDLYVTSLLTDSILRYDGTTGAFLGEFVAGGSGGLDYPAGLSFGPDGNLYVSSVALGEGNTAVLRFQGPSGRKPGAFIDTFVPPGSGGLLAPFALLFGPDGNGDGRQDLYVANNELVTGSSKGKEHTNTVKLYDGVTAAYLRDFVTVDTCGP